MRQLEDERRDPTAGPDPQDLEALIREVRRRTRRRRLRNIAAVLLAAAIGGTSYALVSGGTNPAPRQSSGTGAGSPQSPAKGSAANTQLVTWSAQRANNLGEIETWSSSNGNTTVQTYIAPNGKVTNVERINYSIKGGELVDQRLELFPTEHEWATSTNLSLASSNSIYDDLIFSPPASIRNLLATHVLRKTSSHMLINGITAVELTNAQPQPANSSPANTKLWINPANDEIVRAVALPGFGHDTNYRWLASTAANRAHLDLQVPRGYTQVADLYAEDAFPQPFLPPANANYKTALDACSQLNPGATNTATKFTELRSGSVGGTPWKLWFGGISNGQPILALLGGSGATAECLSPGLQVVNRFNLNQSTPGVVTELPGRPAVFVTGLLAPASITSIHVVVTGSGNEISVPMYSLPGTTDRYAFKEITGMSCSDLNNYGLSYSLSAFSGAKQVSGGNSGGGGSMSPPCTP
jgi:hypothetical protein